MYIPPFALAPLHTHTHAHLLLAALQNNFSNPRVKPSKSSKDKKDSWGGNQEVIQGAETSSASTLVKLLPTAAKILSLGFYTRFRPSSLWWSYAKSSYTYQ